MKLFDLTDELPKDSKVLKRYNERSRQQRLFIGFFCHPESPTKGNALASARCCGYEKTSARGHAANWMHKTNMRETISLIREHYASQEG